MDQAFLDRFMKTLGPPSSVPLVLVDPLEKYLMRSLPSDFSALMKAYGAIIGWGEDEAVIRLNTIPLPSVDIEDFVEEGNRSAYEIAEFFQVFTLRETMVGGLIFLLS